MRIKIQRIERTTQTGRARKSIIATSLFLPKPWNLSTSNRMLNNQ